ncbi:MAG: ABC transporter ATP-binding protein [Desulfuromonas sp.]
MEPVIAIDNLSKCYRNKKFRMVQALRGLCLQIQPGEVFGFLGPNGAGKSTTIKTLMGLIRPTAGCARLFGVPVELPKARQRVGYLPENPAFYDHLTARAYLRFVAAAFDLAPATVARQSQWVLELLDLQAAADRPIRGYSKGMVQRLGLAQALVHDPDLYILDEPLSGLDPIGRALVKDIILELKKQGKTVFFSTHVTADAERVCDRIGVIVGGVLQAERQVSELLREGVEGYYCRVRPGADEMLSIEGAVVCGEGVIEVFVPRQEFDIFAARLVNQGGAFDLIEPRRRDVEDYFLSLVEDAGENSCG